MATDVWTNKTVPADHVEAKPFGNGIDVCPVCGKPSTIGKPITNYDGLVSKSPEELAEWLGDTDACPPGECKHIYDAVDCPECWLDWLRQEGE